ncbi:hypothetical protein HPGCJGGD_4354 [Methylobacterium haplocladii]|nr:hypothetical protein HPGCJGGD_4354 [Methylobacterium haplocladii]
MRHPDDDLAARAYCPGHLRQEAGRILHMLHDLEGAGDIVGALMRDEMIGQALGPRPRVGCRVSGKVWVQTGVARIRHAMAEGSEPAAHVEHPIARPDLGGGKAELPAVGIAQIPLHAAIGVEPGVEIRVAREHRIEEIEAGRRLPQAETPDSPEARTRVGPEQDTP